MSTTRPYHSPPATPAERSRLTWSERYGEAHRLVRIVDLPASIVGPKIVRLYRRKDHFVLQWWDPAARKNLSDRIDGDLVAAIAHARQIEERLVNFRTSGHTRRRLGHSELVERFLEDLARRAEAGEIDPRTVARYTSSLGHYLAFAGQPEIASSYPYITGVNRTFQLKLAGFLKQRTITSNGHPHTPRRPMKNSIFVEDTVRAMYQWAADPERGHLLPDGFRNPFLSAARPRRELAPDPVGVPDISMEMAGQFLEACDAYQLPLFATIVLFGLRAAEPAHLFQESLRDGWLQVPCIPELSILTKGRRNKTLPVLPLLNKLLLQERHQGLIFLRRNVLESREDAPLANASLSILIEEFRSRSTRNGCNGICSMEKLDLRNQILKEAGGLCYDQIEAEFQRVARKLGWPRIATLKDFRHLFSTSLENAGVPLYFRQYLMGQAPTNAPITTYTHLAPEKIRNHYDRAIQQEFQPVLGALQRRISAIPSSTLIGSRKTDALDGLDDGRDTSVAFI